MQLVWQLRRCFFGHTSAAGNPILSWLLQGYVYVRTIFREENRLAASARFQGLTNGVRCANPLEELAVQSPVRESW